MVEQVYAAAEVTLYMLEAAEGGTGGDEAAASHALVLLASAHGDSLAYAQEDALCLRAMPSVAAAATPFAKLLAAAAALRLQVRSDSPEKEPPVTEVPSRQDKGSKEAEWESGAVPVSRQAELAIPDDQRPVQASQLLPLHLGMDAVTLSGGGPAGGRGAAGGGGEAGGGGTVSGGDANTDCSPVVHTPSVDGARNAFALSASSTSGSVTPADATEEAEAAVEAEAAEAEAEAAAERAAAQNEAAAELVALLGRPESDRAIARYLQSLSELTPLSTSPSVHGVASLGTSARSRGIPPERGASPALPPPEVKVFPPSTKYVSPKGLGVSLCFENGVLDSLHFYSEGVEGFGGFRGALPHGLRLSATEGAEVDCGRTVVERLGEPTAKGGTGRQIWMTYEHLGLKIDLAAVDWEDGGAGLRGVSLWCA